MEIFTIVFVIIGLCTALVLSARAMIRNLSPTKETSDIELILTFITPIIIGYLIGRYSDNYYKEKKLIKN